MKKANSNHRFRSVANRLASSYHEDIDSTHYSGVPLPSEKAIIRLAGYLREILFPGFDRRIRQTCRHEVPRIQTALERIFHSLSEQFQTALQYTAIRDHGVDFDPANIQALGQERAEQFVESLPRLRSMLAKDVEAAFNSDPAARSLQEVLLCYPGIEATAAYRIAHEIDRCGIPIIPRMISEWAHRQTGIDIHYAARIGPSFFIDHGTGVVIGETCDIASNVKLYQGVTLGAYKFERDAEGNLLRGKKRHPTLERNVTVYANSTILGGDTVIGANSVIGAGVMLSRSVEANMIVTPDEPALTYRGSRRSNERKLAGKQRETSGSNRNVKVASRVSEARNANISRKLSHSLPIVQIDSAENALILSQR